MKFDKKEPAIGKKSGRNTPGTEKKVCKAGHKARRGQPVPGVIGRHWAGMLE